MSFLTKIYRKKSAGAVMDTAVPIFDSRLTVAQVKEKLNQEIVSFSTVNYIYLVDEKTKLVGVLSIKNLLREDNDHLALDAASDELVTVHKNLDQEEVAHLALKHNIKAVPVVNEKQQIIGAVPSDEILNILHSEHLEDALIRSGFQPSENPNLDLTKTSAFYHLRKRILWLIVGLFGGILAAWVVGLFEGTFKEELALVAFIPAVVYMADAVGAQAQMIFIQSITLKTKLKIKDYIKREIRVNLLLSIILGAIIFLISFWWLKSVRLSIILGISILLTVLMSMFVAILLPWILKKYKQDPAIASGPPATVIRDITSLLIYFAVAVAILAIWPVV